MTRQANELARVSALTLGQYNHRADDFWEGTRDHDVTQNIDALLRHIDGPAPFRILDLGCGPGRDLKLFSDRGHTAVGLDGAERFVAMARSYSGCEVWHQDFLRMALPDGNFHGIFANASLFHIPSRELPRVLSELHAALKTAGVLFSSNPRGRNEEGWHNGRYGAYYDLDTWRGHLSAAGFSELMHYYRPGGVPLDQRPWLASVWRRLSSIP